MQYQFPLAIELYTLVSNISILIETCRHFKQIPLTLTGVSSSYFLVVYTSINLIYMIENY